MQRCTAESRGSDKQLLPPPLYSLTVAWEDFLGQEGIGCKFFGASLCPGKGVDERGWLPEGWTGRVANYHLPGPGALTCLLQLGACYPFFALSFMRSHCARPSAKCMSPGSACIHVTCTAFLPCCHVPPHPFLPLVPLHHNFQKGEDFLYITVPLLMVLRSLYFIIFFHL